MYINEDGDEKKEKLKKCAKKITATIASKSKENKRKIIEITIRDEKEIDEQTTKMIESEDDNEE